MTEQKTTENKAEKLKRLEVMASATFAAWYAEWQDAPKPDKAKLEDLLRAVLNYVAFLEPESPRPVGEFLEEKKCLEEKIIQAAVAWHDSADWADDAEKSVQLSEIIVQYCTLLKDYESDPNSGKVQILHIPSQIEEKRL